MDTFSVDINVNFMVEDVCINSYPWNTSTCACECDKHCEIDGYLKRCTFRKGIIDDL